MRFNIMASLLTLGYCAMAHAGFLQPTSFPKTVDDLSFVDRMNLKYTGYDDIVASEYDENGNCVSGCSYAMPKWEDELEARARWDALSRKNLKENYGYSETTDGVIIPPSDDTVSPPSDGVESLPYQGIIMAPPKQQDTPTAHPVTDAVKDCEIKNSSFKSHEIPYGNPLGYKSCITSGYGKRVIDDNTEFHYGLDFRVPIGTPVYSPADGVVKKVFVRHKRCGNGLEIEHSGGYSTKYCHFESLAVKKDDKISVGCLIGKSGNTGRSTGPHLHYSVLYQGQSVNPTNFIEPGHQNCRK